MRKGSEGNNNRRVRSAQARLGMNWEATGGDID